MARGTEFRAVCVVKKTAKSGEGSSPDNKNNKPGAKRPGGWTFRHGSSLAKLRLGLIVQLNVVNTAGINAHSDSLWKRV